MVCVYYILLNVVQWWRHTETVYIIMLFSGQAVQSFLSKYLSLIKKKQLRQKRWHTHYTSTDIAGWWTCWLNVVLGRTGILCDVIAYCYINIGKQVNIFKEALLWIHGIMSHVYKYVLEWKGANILRTLVSCCFKYDVSKKKWVQINYQHFQCDAQNLILFTTIILVCTLDVTIHSRYDVIHITGFTIQLFPQLKKIKNFFFIISVYK